MTSSMWSSDNFLGEFLRKTKSFLNQKCTAVTLETTNAQKSFSVFLNNNNAWTIFYRSTLSIVGWFHWCLKPPFISCTGLCYNRGLFYVCKVVWDEGKIDCSKWAFFLYPNDDHNDGSASTFLFSKWSSTLEWNIAGSTAFLRIVENPRD